MQLLREEGRLLVETQHICIYVVVLDVGARNVCFRVAEVGRLWMNANNAFNSFVERVFANLRQKTLYLCVLPKYVVFVRICKYMEHCF